LRLRPEPRSFCLRGAFVCLGRSSGSHGRAPQPPRSQDSRPRAAPSPRCFRRRPLQGQRRGALSSRPAASSRCAVSASPLSKQRGQMKGRLGAFAPLRGKLPGSIHGTPAEALRTIGGFVSPHAGGRRPPRGNVDRARLYKRDFKEVLTRWPALGPAIGGRGAAALPSYREAALLAHPQFIIRRLWLPAPMVSRALAAWLRAPDTSPRSRAFL